METNPNQRSFQRHDCNIVVHYDAHNQCGIGVLKDVSRGGVRLKCRPTKDLGPYVKLSTFGSSGCSSSNACLGRVMWHDQDYETGQFELGIKLPLSLQWLEKALMSSKEAVPGDDPETRLDNILKY